ncbi:hypothetical protein CCR75_004213 [Bremia lactucae]|uniref:Uncharacterized protein n=1 Tax=Bremia lactucae TaxID=4779 RepID=A0A976IGF4_BRELC|nr:hypothetical protein CCR75_004213 [Bremia lactucae]
MFAAHEVNECTFKSLCAKQRLQIVPRFPSGSNDSKYLLDDESRRGLVRLGAVGRRYAVVAL